VQGRGSAGRWGVVGQETSGPENGRNPDVAW